MIHAGEVTPRRRGKAVERARADENAVQVKQGRRAGTGMEHGNRKKTVRLLQQSDGAPRFGKHGLQLCLVQGVSESRQRARQRVFSR